MAPVVGAFEKAAAKGEGALKDLLCNSAEILKLAETAHLTTVDPEKLKNDPCVLDMIKHLDNDVTFQDKKLATGDLCADGPKYHEFYEEVKKVATEKKKYLLEEAFGGKLKLLKG